MLRTCGLTTGIHPLARACRARSAHWQARASRVQWHVRRPRALRTVPRKAWGQLEECLVIDRIETLNRFLNGGAVGLSYASTVSSNLEGESHRTARTYTCP